MPNGGSSLALCQSGHQWKGEIMSTRATIHFQEYGHTAAIVYRHSDGYPDGLGADLQRFFSEVQETVKDTRFGDPRYLAAKWVVWDASQHSQFESYTEGKKSASAARRGWDRGIS